MPLASPPRAVLLTLLAGLSGALVLAGLGLPAPWISGAMVGIVVMMVAGYQPVMPPALRDAGMLLAGCATGSTITREMLEALEHYPFSILMLVLTTLAVTYGSAFMLRKVFRWDPWSAFFGAVPGALSVVFVAVGEIGGNMARVVAAQAFRLFLLIALLPSLIMHAVRIVPVATPAVLPPLPFALQAFGGFLLSLLFLRLKVVAAWFLGGMVAAGALQLGKIVSGAPPAPVSNLALLLVGIYAASRMAGTTGKVLRALWLPCLVLLASSTTIALAGGYVTHLVSGVPLASALVAFAPGGLEAMVALGLALGLDPLYVTSHHVGRFVILTMLLPLMARHIPGAKAWRAAQREGGINRT